jgi:hypothetical protein
VIDCGRLVIYSRDLLISIEESVTEGEACGKTELDADWESPATLTKIVSPSMSDPFINAAASAADRESSNLMYPYQIGFFNDSCIGDLTKWKEKLDQLVTVHGCGDVTDT